MSLLDEIADTALEPGYAIRTEQRAAQADAGRHAPRSRHRALHAGLAVALGIAGFLVAIIVTDLRQGAPEAAQIRGQLAVRAEDRAAATDALSAEVQALRREVAAARDTELEMFRQW